MELIWLPKYLACILLCTCCNEILTLTELFWIIIDNTHDDVHEREAWAGRGGAVMHSWNEENFMMHKFDGLKKGVETSKKI